MRDRKEQFEGRNEFVRARQGWITSIPGAPDMTVECLPGSTLPVDLCGLGYDVTATGEGERILHNAMTEQLVIGADGELSPLTEASTRPITTTVHHAGIVEVKSSKAAGELSIDICGAPTYRAVIKRLVRFPE